MAGKLILKYFVTHENYMKLKFKCPQIKFYCNTVMLFHLHIVMAASAPPGHSLVSTE